MKSKKLLLTVVVSVGLAISSTAYAIPCWHGIADSCSASGMQVITNSVDFGGLILIF